jgi:parallel beta-helix repeat protein
MRSNKNSTKILFILAFLLFVVGFLLLAKDVFAATYYVSYSSGNDSNDGLTPNAAWKYCPRMLSTEDDSDLNPDHAITTGDTVYFKRGDIWDGVSIYVPPNIGGITFSSRTDFAIPGNESVLPQIRSWSSFNDGWIQEYGTIYSKALNSNSIRRTGLWYNGTALAWVESTNLEQNQWYWDATNPPYKVYINVGANPNNQDIRMNYEGKAISTMQLYGDNYVVEYLDLSGSSFSALYIDKYDFVQNALGGTANNNIVRYNKLHDTERNFHSPDSGDSSGIRRYAQGIEGAHYANTQFIGNEIYNISTSVSFIEHRAHGIYISGGDNVTIAYNYIHDCHSGSAVHLGDGYHHVTNSKIYGNLLDSNYYAWLSALTENTIIANNTITNGLHGISMYDAQSSVKIVNNLFSNPLNNANPSGGDIEWWDNAFATPDYNYYYRPADEYILRVKTDARQWYKISEWSIWRQVHPDWDSNSTASTNSPFSGTSDQINILATGKGQDLTSILGTDMVLDPKSTWPLGVKLLKQNSGAWDIGAYKSLINNCSLPGDINGDNQVNSSDLAIAVNIFFNIDTASSQTCPSQADLNADGQTDISDIQKIINLML